jgi:N-methylhydantoinase B
MRRPANPPPAVRLALVRGLFAACAEEMGITLMRSAYSPNIKERLDFSCAVFDGRARLVAQAAHIPVHLGSLPRAVEAALERAPFEDGDAVMLNDPYRGGTHLPDLTLVSPVFLPGRRRPDFFVASRAHHADIGGAAPGSMPLARTIYEEGFRSPPVFLVRGGRVVTDVLALLLANVRTAEERRADLEAQLGAQTTGARRLVEMAERNGPRELVSEAARLLAHGERVMRAAFAALPRGAWSFEDALDEDGLGHGPIPLRVRVRFAGEGAVVDFRGSSPQVEGPVNAVEAVTFAATQYALRCVLGGDLPVDHGAFRPVQVIAPRGTVVNARPPAAVSAGNVETSQRIVDVVLGALARALPERVPAASSGTMNNLLIGGAGTSGESFAYYETLAGGHGAGPGWDGASAMQAHMTNTRNTPVEALEHAYPLRVIETRIRRGSGGKGRWRGGDGVVRTLELTAAAQVTVISERRLRGPYGLRGGEPGAPGTNSTRGSAKGSARRRPGKFQIALPSGARLTIATPGGGGFGSSRAPGEVRRRRRRSGGRRASGPPRGS